MLCAYTQQGRSSLIRKHNAIDWSAQSKCKRKAIYSIYCITLYVLWACLHVCYHKILCHIHIVEMKPWLHLIFIRRFLFIWHFPSFGFITRGFFSVDSLFVWNRTRDRWYCDKKHFILPASDLSSFLFFFSLLMNL